MAIKFSPNSLDFTYNGSPTAKQEITPLYSTGEVVDQQQFDFFILYNQAHANWLQVEESGNSIEQGLHDGWPNIFRLSVNPTETIPDGNYNAYFNLSIGKKSGEYYEILQTGEFRVYLTVNAGVADFTITPTSAVLHVNKSQKENPTKALNITTPGNFTISGNDLFQINGKSLPFIVSQSGEYVLSTTDKARTLVTGPSNHQLNITKNGVQYSNFSIQLLVTQTANLEVTPMDLSFFGIKGIAEPEWQYVYVYAPNAVSFNRPNWLDVRLVSTEGSFKTYMVKPINSATLNPITMQGDLVFSDLNTSQTVRVAYNLQGLYNENYIKPFHFTQDGEELMLVQSAQDKVTFLRIQMTIQYYDFAGKKTEKNKIENYNFFNKRVTVDPGQVIHDIFSYYNDNVNERFPNINTSTGNYPQYQFASIYFNVQEVDFETNEVVMSYVIPRQYYMKGRKPILPNNVLETDNRLLSHRIGSTTKVSRNGFIVYNYVKVSSGDIALKLNGKNIPFPGKLPNVIPQGSNVNIYGAIIRLSDIENLKINDVIQLSISGQTLNYIVEEDGLNSVHVFYRNQFDLLSHFELTGEFIIDGAYERVTTKTFENWVEINKNLSTTKTQNLKINSGYISKENIRILDEINMAKKAFLLIGNKVIDARPISSKMQVQVSRDNLVNREVEFELINKHYDDLYLF